MAATTTSELITRLQHEIRDEANITATEARLLARLDEAHLEIVGGGGILNDNNRGIQKGLPFVFPWALSEKNIIVNTVAPISTGTISVTQSSTSATLSATQATSVAGWFLKIDGEPEVYEVDSHAAGTDALTLDGAYVGTTNASASYTLYKLDYDFEGDNLLLPSNGLLVSYYDRPLPIFDATSFMESIPLQQIGQGFPSVAGLMKQDVENDRITLRLSAYTEEIERIELPYVPRPATLTTSGVNPILPDDSRDILVQLAAYKELESRDDDAAIKKLRLATDQFKVLKSKAFQHTARYDKNWGKRLAFPGGIDTLNNRSGYYDHPNRFRKIQ